MSSAHRSAILIAAALALLLISVSACGRKTEPRPVGSIAPAPQSVEAHQVDAELRMSWREPTPLQIEAFGGLRGWVVDASRLPDACLNCPAVDADRLTLAVGDPRLQRKGGRVFLRLPAGMREGLWRLRATHWFGAGAGQPSGTVLVRGLAQIPTTRLRARRLEAGAETAAALRLEWDRPTEARVHIAEAGAPPGERTLRYRGNVYRRRPHTAWPPLPLNPEPLSVPTWLVPQDADGEPGEGWEYAVRLVDRFGGEGPLSEPLPVTPVEEPP